MIEKMNLVYVVSTEAKKQSMLLALRDLGVLHISEKKDADEKRSNKLIAMQKVMLTLKDYEVEQKAEPLEDKEFEELFEKTKKAIEKKAYLGEVKAAKLLEIDKLRAWGDFSPDEVKRLSGAGLDFHFYKIDNKGLKKLGCDENIKFVKLGTVDKMNSVAVLGELDGSYFATEFIVPEKGISELEAELDIYNSELEAIEELLKESASQMASYNAQLIKVKNKAELSSAKNTLESQDGIVWLKGYIPQSETESFVKCAKENGWAYQYEEVEDDDGVVPTKIKYNKLTGLMKPIFEILGTVPGYGEFDISFWFLAFFTLFFAMIIGDAGYGVVFLLGAIVWRVKKKKTDNAILLLSVLSVATIIWGALTGTWFGTEAAMKIPFFKSLVIPNFANYPQYFGVENTSVQNSVMKFCFSIGVIQLALACVMNIRRKITQKDLSMLADFGWLVAISALYYMVLYLVIGQEINLKLIGILIGVGFLVVVVFGGMSPDKSFAQGLKAGFADTFTTFLNTISAFGNVMSYIRLFAVGMASLAIAQSFNNMSSGFSGALIVVGIVIAVLGHVMNIVMGLLSVIVHGVRLNLLEFSGQLGMEWSGKAYEPFKEQNNDK